MPLPSKDGYLHQLSTTLPTDRSGETCLICYVDTLPPTRRPRAATSFATSVLLNGCNTRIPARRVESRYMR